MKTYCIAQGTSLSALWWCKWEVNPKEELIDMYHWFTLLCLRNQHNIVKQLCGGRLVAKLCPVLVTPWTIPHEAPLSMAFPRQEYWSGLPFPCPGDLHHPRIEPRSPALQVDSLLSEPPYSNKNQLKNNFFFLKKRQDKERKDNITAPEADREQWNLTVSQSTQKILHRP